MRRSLVKAWALNILNSCLCVLRRPVKFFQCFTFLQVIRLLVRYLQLFINLLLQVVWVFLLFCSVLCTNRDTVDQLSSGMLFHCQFVYSGLLLQSRELLSTENYSWRKLPFVITWIELCMRITVESLNQNNTLVPAWLGMDGWVFCRERPLSFFFN